MGNRKILIADYNTRDLQQMKKLFGDSGFDVVTAQDGKAALEIFARELPEVVLLSAMLSKVNGFDVCKQIKETDAGKDTPVIIATSVYKGQKYRIKAIHENKASEFIEKPVPDEQLVETVRRFTGDTQSLISSRKSAIAAKPAAPAAAPTRPSAETEKSADEMLDAMLSPGSHKPPAEAKPAPAPAPTPASPKASPDKSMADIENLFRSELSQSPGAAPAAADSDDSLDRLLSDTLSGLGISLDTKDKGGKKPAPPKPEKPPISSVPGIVDTGELKFQQLKDGIFKDDVAAENLKAVEKMMSFDTDLERKLSDTLSGVGMSDTSIGQVIESVHPETPEEAPDEGTKFGDYVLVEKIGHGGMAELFKAKKRGHEGFQKIVAIKRILPHLSDNKELVTMFIDEAKIAAQLSHQNIANIFDFGKTDNAYYIAMEFVDGFDLKKALSKAKELKLRFPHKLAALVAQQVCSALDYAHHKKDFNNKDLNIVHRDVSPQNVILSREGEVKLVDFGISKAESKIHHTVKGALKGKLLYMSPEQAWGKTVNQSSDLYSLGIVLCEMVSGKVLFEDSSEFDVLEKVRSGKIPLLDQEQASLPPRLKAIVDKALQIESDKRYANAASMSKDLHDYLHSGPSVPTHKDLAQFMFRLFPEIFGLKEADVQNLSFEEFQEKPAVVPAKPDDAETVAFDEAELAALPKFPPPPAPEPVPAPPTPAPAPPPPKASPAPVLLEDGEIVVPEEAGASEPLLQAPIPAAPPKPAKPVEVPKPAPAKLAPSAPKAAQKPIEMKKGPDKQVPRKGAPEPKPKKGPEPAPRPAEEKTPTKLLKETKKVSPAPVFGAKPAPAKKSLPVGMIIGIVVAAVALVVILFLVFGGKSAEQPAKPATPSGATGEAPTAGAPAEGSAAPTSESPAGGTPAAPAGTQETPAAAKPATQPVAPAINPNARAAAINVIPGSQAGTAAAPTIGLPFASSQPAPMAPAPAPAAPPPPTRAAAQPQPQPVQPKSDFQLSLPAAAQQQVLPGSTVALTPDVKAPRPVSQPMPANPTDAAKRMNLRGQVVVTCRLLISDSGSVEKVVVQNVNPANASSIYSGPVQAALSKWRYTPAEKSGVKVKVWITVPLAFQTR